MSGRSKLEAIMPTVGTGVSLAELARWAGISEETAADYLRRLYPGQISIAGGLVFFDNATLEAMQDPPPYQPDPEEPDWIPKGGLSGSKGHNPGARAGANVIATSFEDLNTEGEIDEQERLEQLRKKGAIGGTKV